MSNHLEQNTQKDQGSEKMAEIDHFANLTELKREDFSVERLGKFVAYYNDVLEMYERYQKNREDNKLYLELLWKIISPRGDLGFGRENLRETDPISRLLRRMCTKAALATLADYLEKKRVSPDIPLNATDVADYLSHGVVKTLMYDDIEDELSRELSLLAAHVYEIPDDGPVISSVNAKRAASFYKRTGNEKHAARVVELETVASGTPPTSGFEKGIKNADEMLAEAQAIVDKYKDMTKLEVIMSDLHKIHGIVQSLLK